MSYYHVYVLIVINVNWNIVHFIMGLMMKTQRLKALSTYEYDHLQIAAVLYSCVIEYINDWE